MYPILIKVRYFDEYSDKKDKMDTDYGILFAEDLVDAALKVKGYYGEDADKVTFEFFDEATDIIPIGPMTAEHIRKREIV